MVKKDRTLNTKLKKQILKAKRQILKEHKDTLGLVLIGSVAEGDHNEDSDIDIVCIKRKRIKLDKRLDFMEKMNDKIQLVTFTRREILDIFKQFTTMAHSMKNGVILYQKDGFINSLFKIRLSNPSRKWMREWFEHWLKRHQWAKDSIKRERRFHKKYCKTKCYCNFFDDMARVTVNFAILYLENHHIIPLSKTQIIKNMERCFPHLSNRALKGLRLALKFSGRDTFLNCKEIDKISFSANWFKVRLHRGLINGEGL